MSGARGLRFDPDSLMQAAQRRITDVELQRSSKEAPWDGEQPFTALAWQKHG